MKQFARTILMALSVVAGATAATGGAHGAPRMAGPIPLAMDAPAVQPVQYYEDWRHREWRRREAFERFQRREARREWRRERHGYGRYGYNRHGGW